MGFFQKLKDNFKHGGVKLQIQAPASISIKDPTLPITVNITSTDSQQSIEQISATIVAESYDHAFSINSTQSSTNHVERRDVARSDFTQQFDIAPGETKSVSINIVMNQAAAAESVLPEGSGVAQFLGALQTLDNITNTLGGAGWKYTVKVTAKVKGITLSPSVEQPIQILKPGEIGAAIQKSINL